MDLTNSSCLKLTLWWRSNRFNMCISSLTDSHLWYLNNLCKQSSTSYLKLRCQFVVVVVVDSESQSVQSVVYQSPSIYHNNIVTSNPTDQKVRNLKNFIRMDLAPYLFCFFFASSICKSEDSHKQDCSNWASIYNVNVNSYNISRELHAFCVINITKVERKTIFEVINRYMYQSFDRATLRN